MISPFQKSKRSFEKYKPRGLFSEFYGIILLQFNKLIITIKF